MRQTTQAQAWEGPFTDNNKILISDFVVIRPKYSQPRHIDVTYLSGDEGLYGLAPFVPGLREFINDEKPHVDPPLGFEEAADVS